MRCAVMRKLLSIGGLLTEAAWQRAKCAHRACKGSEYSCKSSVLTLRIGGAKRRLLALLRAVSRLLTTGALTVHTTAVGVHLIVCATVAIELHVVGSIQDTFMFAQPSDS